MSLNLRLPVVLQSVSRRAILYMIFASFCFAAVELLGGLLVRAISPYQLVWGRYSVHLLFMVAFLSPRYKTRLIKTSHLKLQILRSLTMVAMPVTFLLATARMPVDNVWSVYWLSPLMMLGLSTLVLHETVGNIRWVAAIIGFVGMLLVYRPNQGILNPASLFALGTGLAISLHLMLSRVLRDDHPLVSLFHTALWVFVVFSFLMPFLWHAPTLSDIVAMVVVGLVGALGLFVLARAGELMPLSVVASFSYAEAIWNLLLRLLLLGVMPGKSELLGTLLITVVIMFLFIYEARQPHS